MLWLSLVVGQNMNRQLVTSSENLVASAQCSVTLATSESQFRALSIYILFRLLLLFAIVNQGNFLARRTEKR